MSDYCVFCGSRAGADPAYLALARETGATLARAGHGIVYGGGSAGLMGALADAALAERGRVTGVIPGFLDDLELAHAGLTRLEVVETMHARKQRMLDLADTVIALPGGIGTLDEIVECITWAQLGLHAKPIWLIGSATYWHPLVTLLEHFEAHGFAHDGLMARFRLADRVDATFCLATASGGTDAATRSQAL